MERKRKLYVTDPSKPIPKTTAWRLRKSQSLKNSFPTEQQGNYIIAILHAKFRLLRNGIGDAAVRYQPPNFGMCEMQMVDPEKLAGKKMNSISVVTRR